MHEIQKRNYINEKNYFFLLFIFSLSISFFYTVDQRAINAALILSDKINYPDVQNVLNIAYHNSWTLTYQILKFLINIGINLKLLNFSILCISIFISTLGIYLISQSISKNITYSLFISCFLILSNIVLGNVNFGNLDYPVLLASEHTNGMLSQAITILIFGLIARNNYNLAINISILILAFHIVIGLWLLTILSLSFLLFKKNFFNAKFFIKKNMIATIIILLVVIFSFVKFKLNQTNIIFEENDYLYNLYLEYWDHHRNKLSVINYKYIFFSTILIIMTFISFKKDNKNNHFFFKVVILQVLTSFIIYIFYKIFPNLFSGILVQIMPTRFFLTHSIFGVAIILSLLFFHFKKKLLNKKFFLLPIFILLIHPVLNYDKYINLFMKLSNNHLMSENESENYFWKKVKNTNIEDGYILTSIEICSKTIQKGYKPILFCIESIDDIAYINKLVVPIHDIIETIYELDFENPPEKNHGGIWYNDTYREVFEKRTSTEWKNISSKFKINALILPIDWKINAKILFFGKKYNYYTFNYE